MKIKEVIVVEGKDDINAVKRAVDAEFITTSGMGINEDILKDIVQASKRCGIIILTDPDYPGERIRNIIKNRVSVCKHAFLSRKDARCKTTGKIGVEYAEPSVIREALIRARAEERSEKKEYFQEDLIKWGLTGTQGGKKRREKLAEILGIGKSNAKQFLGKLNTFNISREEVINALNNIKEYEEL